MPRMRDTSRANLAVQRYGKGAEIFLTQQELEQAFGGSVGRVRYLVKPWSKRTIIIHLQEEPCEKENSNA